MPSKIKPKAKNGETYVRAILSHVMDTGLAKDKAGNVIPAHFIQNIVCKWKGETVLTADWSGAVSKNPYFAFKFKGGAAGDPMELTWVDNKGETETVTANIE